MTNMQQISGRSPVNAATLRKKAEERARSMEPTSLSTLTPEEIQQVFHELRVHQIELEIQNAELRTAQTQIEAERACYFNIYDQAPVGYCTLSEKGLILEGNLTAATLLGVTRSAMVKQSFSRFILKEDLDIYYLNRKHLFDSGTPQESELRLVKSDGTLFWVHLTATAAQAEDDAPVCRMIFSDITKHKEAERELFLKENIIKSSSCAIATCDLKGNMTYGNPFFLKLWELNGLEDILGEPIQNFWMLGGYDKEVMKELQSEGTWAGELKGIRKDGSLFDVQVSAATVLDNSGNSIALTSTSIDITDRKRTEEALKESELRARAMLQAIPDMMFRFNSHGVFLDFKADTSELYAQDVPTIIGKCSRDILPPEFVDLLDENTRTALETDSLQTFEYQLPVPGRGMRDYECRMIRSAADEVTAIVRDITVRKWREDSLRKSEELLTESQRLSKVGGWGWNVATQTMYWTEEMYRIHDFMPGEMEPGSKEHIKRSVECYDPEDRPIILAAFQRCAEEGQPFDFELPFTTAKGRRLWIRTTARPVYESGKVIRVIGNFIDITERKRAEETLIAERNRLEFVIDGSRLGTWTWNVQTNEAIFSETCAAMLGYSLGELTPTSTETWIALTHPEDLKKAEALLALCLADETHDYTCELRMKHKDGHWVWILTRGRIMTWDDTGKPLSMFGTHDDITDRKHHEQQLAAALSEKEVLLREVHHRVKNNLAAIISLIEMQGRDIEDPNNQIILTELSNRIRSMSLIHEKLYQTNSLANINFQNYTQALIAHLLTAFGSPCITYRVDAHGISIPLDLASPCGMIVNELISNALKYAFPDGKPRPGNTDCQIMVRLQRDQDTYTLTVADNGIGWPAEYDWTKASTLGLTLVRMLGQHQLGGRYVVDQENGTSITLTFTDMSKEVPVLG